MKGSIAIVLLLLAGRPLLGSAEPAGAEGGPLQAQTRTLLAALTRLPDQPRRRLIIGQNLGTAEQAAAGYRTYVDDPAPRLGGRRPLLVGIDYGWDRFDAAAIASANQVLIAHWKQGGLVTVCMHPGSPFVPDGTVRQLDGVDLEAAVTPGTAANRRWMAMLATVADGLDGLRRAGVVVLWRPLHEMNGGWFWWGSRAKGATGGSYDPRRFVALWRHCHRYLTEERGLDNLIWIYAPNARVDRHIRPVAEAYPGPEVVDLVGYDLYTDAVGPAVWDANGSYRELIALGKPFAVTELGPGGGRRGAFPSQTAMANLLATCPRTCFAMYWHGWHEGAPPARRYQAMGLPDNPQAAELLAQEHVRTLADGRPAP